MHEGIARRSEMDAATAGSAMRRKRKNDTIRSERRTQRDVTSVTLAKGGCSSVRNRSKLFVATVAKWVQPCQHIAALGGDYAAGA